MLSRLEESIFYAKISKFDLKHELNVLGYLISAGDIKVGRLKSVQAWSQPTNLKDLRSFLGLATFFRRFVQGFSLLDSPPYKPLA